jgi:hypothetical protein
MLGVMTGVTHTHPPVYQDIFKELLPFVGIILFFIFTFFNSF